MQHEQALHAGSCWHAPCWMIRFRMKSLFVTRLWQGSPELGFFLKQLSRLIVEDVTVDGSLMPQLQELHAADLGVDGVATAVVGPDA